MVLPQLSKRKAIIVSTDMNDGWFIITAEIPLNNMFGYSAEIRSSTQGKGEFTMEYARYSPSLPEVQEQLIRQYQESQGIVIAQKSKN